LIDKTEKHNLADLRSLQDWFLKYELQTIEGVSEVAAIGGMVKQYQVIVDPNRLRSFGIPLVDVRRAIERGNMETGVSIGVQN
jgi:Cu(I)/Ag(I) efflux system membrane protein CusA/SilA